MMHPMSIHPRPSWLILAAAFALATPLACGDSGESGGNTGGGGPCMTTSDCGANLICYQGTCVDADFTPGPTDEEQEELGGGLGGGDEPAGYGEVIDSFCGLNAYQNGPKYWESPAKGPFGWEFQCTEMAYRFTCQHFDMCEKKVGAYGDAKSWYNNYGDPVLSQMTRFPNGGTEPPRPGDILAANNGEFGHVAIVKYVKDGYVYVLEQNVFNGNHKYPIEITDGHYKMLSKWQGWMRAPNGPAICGDDLPADCATGSFLGTPTVMGGILHAEGTVGASKGILKYSLVIGEDTIYTQEFPQPGPTAAPFNVDIDIAGQGIPAGAHTLGLWVKDVEQCTGGAAVDAADLVIEGMSDDCGNGSLDGAEDCDGNALGGKSCQSLGWTGGNLTCTQACSFDTSGCTNNEPSPCPNGKKDGDENCDGADLGGASCQSLGWTGGTLVCSQSCGFDTSGCTSDKPIMCQDNKKEGSEQCDGLDLGGESCMSQGFTGGTLNCTNNCILDTSECMNKPMCSYSVDPQSPDSSYAAPYVCPGAIAMPVSGSINAQTGQLTVSSPGKNGGYGPGNYRVVVFDPNDVIGNQCKSFNVVKATKVLGQQANSITFPAFDSLLQCGGADKAYCIQKEDGGNLDHFCSGKLVASYK